MRKWKVLSVLTVASLLAVPALQAAGGQKGAGGKHKSTKLTEKQSAALHKNAVEFKPAGEVRTTTAKKGSTKISSQPYQVTVKLPTGGNGTFAVSVSCTGSCAGGCSPDGCRLEGGDCSKIVCGASCNASCTRTETSSDDALFQALEALPG